MISTDDYNKLKTEKEILSKNNNVFYTKTLELEQIEREEEIELSKLVDDVEDLVSFFNDFNSKIGSSLNTYKHLGLPNRLEIDFNSTANQPDLNQFVEKTILVIVFVLAIA